MSVCLLTDELVHTTPRAASQKPGEGAVSQTKGLQQAELQHTSNKQIDTFYERDCFGSPVVSSPLHFLKPEDRQTPEATHLKYLPTITEALKLQDPLCSQASGQIAETSVMDAFPATDTTAQEIQPQVSREEHLGVDQQGLAPVSREATQAAVQAPSVPSIPNFLVAPFNTAKDSIANGNRDPSTPLTNGPPLPSCFRMEESTPSKSPADSAPDYFPSPEMTQKVRGMV